MTKEKNKEIETEKPAQNDFEKKVIELSESGLTSEKIGENLRKQGLHSKNHPRKISKILKEKGKHIDPDLKNAEDKLNRIQAHFEKNRQDKRAKHELQRVSGQVRKIKQYMELID